MRRRTTAPLLLAAAVACALGSLGRSEARPQPPSREPANPWAMRHPRRVAVLHTYGVRVEVVVGRARNGTLLYLARVGGGSAGGGGLPAAPRAGQPAWL